MAEQGSLLGDTLVWCDGMADWAEASTVPELAAVINEVTAKRQREEAEAEAARQKAEEEAAAEAARKKAEAARKRAEAAKKKAEAEAAAPPAGSETAKKGPSKKPMLLIIGIVLLVATYLVDFEDIPGFDILLDTLWMDNETISMIAWALIVIGGLLALTRLLKRRNKK
jgi:cation transport ATPase